ncbi:glycosyltransferase [Clostridium butyricum]|uniref:glycosyltransferase n=1 Tax=Clostridium butyricum TaxID=1492 RepID=UPI0003FFAF7F|nr:glycosyltransferase [Clostridium butyricum]
MKVLYFSTVNWKWIKQRPHFICEYLSKNNYYVTYFSMTPLFKQKIVNNRVNKYLNINDKYVLPYSSKLKPIRGLNSVYVKKILNKDYDIIILTHPEQYRYLPNRLLKSNVKVIYECMDNIPYFYNKKIQIGIRYNEKNLCEKVDKIITSSYYLKDRIMSEYDISERKISVIKNALDKSILEVRDKKLKLMHPNLMYIGTVDDWFDTEILNEFATNHSQYTIYILGPNNRNIVNKLNSKNIIFLGTIEHELISSYLKNGDIMLIPFKVNELIRGVDPVKIYEYLTFNKPVITSYWKELDTYKKNDLVKFYTTYSDFEVSVEEAINKVNLESDFDSDFINLNSWSKRIEKYIQVLKSI